MRCPYRAVSLRVLGETGPGTGGLDKEGPPILVAWSTQLKAEREQKASAGQFALCWHGLPSPPALLYRSTWFLNFRVQESLWSVPHYPHNSI